MKRAYLYNTTGLAISTQLSGNEVATGRYCPNLKINTLMMKKYFGCFLFSLFMLVANSQIIQMETGKTISTFRYKDSNGNLLDDLNGSNQNSLGLGFRKSIHMSKLNFSLTATYNRYGALGSNPVLGNYYEWDITCIGANFGLDYEFYRPPVNYNEQHGFSFYPKIAVASEFLVNGMQNLNDQIHDLKGVEEFDKPFYFLRGGFGANFYISKTYILFAEYMGGKSFLIGDYKGQEQLRIVTHNISVGISVNLFYINE